MNLNSKKAGEMVEAQEKLGGVRTGAKHEVACGRRRKRYGPTPDRDVRRHLNHSPHVVADVIGIVGVSRRNESREGQAADLAAQEVEARYRLRSAVVGCW